jgi:hypothetical protein
MFIQILPDIYLCQCRDLSLPEPKGMALHTHCSFGLQSLLLYVDHSISDISLGC